MILTCPDCGTRYSADAAKFPPGGRKVKCAKCGHSWHQDPPAPEPVVEEQEQVLDEPAPSPPTPPPPPVVEPPRASAFVPEPEIAAPQFTMPAPVAVAGPAIEAMPAGPRRPSLLPGRLGVLVGWGLLAGILIVAGWAAITYRQSVAMLWPQTSSLYAAIGMPVNALGIDFADVSYKRERQDGQSVLAISGKLTNVSGREQSVPQIRAALSDEENRELYHWKFSAGVATMRSGQSVKFITRISSPPPAAKHLEVRFARDGE